MSEVSTGAPAPEAAPIAAEPVSQESVESTQDSSVDQSQQPQEAQTKKDEAKAASTKKKYNLKVNGKQEDLELDLSNDEEISKYLQKARAFDTKAQEAAEIKNKWQLLATI